MKVKVTILFKNGKTLTIKGKSVRFSKLTDNASKSLEIEEADKNWAVDLNEVVAITSKKVLF